MKLKRDAKFGEESTRPLKIGMSNLMNFDPSVRKVSKIFILMGSFWAKYILFELKKYREIIFHETEEGYKTWRGINLPFQNWHKKFDKFWSEHFKSLKMFVVIGSLWPKIYCLSYKGTDELSFMTLRGYANFEEKLTGGLKKDMRIWQIFTRALESVKIGTLMGSFCPK